MTTFRIRLMGLIGLVAGIAAGLVVWPEIDIAVSNAFFDTQMFIWRMSPFATTVHDMVHPVSLAFAGLFAVLTAVAWKQGQGWRRWAFVLLALILAPGFLTNTVLKDHWGRARPEQTMLFGGQEDFTRALIPTEHCTKNCSFVAGDAAFGFWFSTLAYIAPRRRRAVFWTGIGVGAALGLIRIGMGAHFFSDVVFAGLINVAAIALLYRVMFGANALSICWHDFLKVKPQGTANSQPT